MTHKTSHRRSFAHSLVELLVVIGLMAAVFSVTWSMLEATQKGWDRTRSNVEQYRDARVAFEALTRRLADAKLHTYWDYEYDNSGLPVRYIKNSDLNFVSGDASKLISGEREDPTYPTHAVFFQGPFGESDNGQVRDLNSLLNAWGYFIEFGSDEPWIPRFVARDRKPKYGFRLIEFRQPTESLTIFKDPNEQTQDWFRADFLDSRKNVVANNIIALVIHPMNSKDEVNPISPDYEYDSRDLADPSSAVDTSHELPSLLRVMMVAIEEGDASSQLGELTAPPAILNIAEVAPFEKAADFEKDPTELEHHLLVNAISYRVFETLIPIRSSRWTASE